MSFRDLMREVFSALDANRGRSLLTILGIVIGIAAVIAMTSLIGGVSQALVGELGLDQSRMLYITGSTPTRDLDADDLEQIELNVPGYDFVTGVQYTSSNISAGAKTEESASLVLVEAQYFDAASVKFIAGSAFSERDGSTGGMVIVLGQPVAKKLFGGDGSDAVGRPVKIGNDSYIVVGVAEAANSYQTESYLPYKTGMSRLADGYGGYAQVIGYAKEGVDANDLADRTRTFLYSYLNVDPNDDESGYVDVTAMQSMIDQLNATMATFSLMMSAVAGISLVVGGIGIMNMMLTNVTERIREIGLRKALGARSSDITKQFLLESVTLCLVGGLIGILLGYGASWALTSVASSLTDGMTVTPAISPTTIAAATGICIAIGVGFGYYPARRAARLNPVESLRFQ